MSKNQSADDAKKIAKAYNEVVEIVAGLPKETQARVLYAAAVLTETVRVPERWDFIER